MFLQCLTYIVNIAWYDAILPCDWGAAVLVSVDIKAWQMKHLSRFRPCFFFCDWLAERWQGSSNVRHRSSNNKGGRFQKLLAWVITWVWAYSHIEQVHSRIVEIYWYVLNIFWIVCVWSLHILTYHEKRISDVSVNEHWHPSCRR